MEYVGRVDILDHQLVLDVLRPAWGEPRIMGIRKREGRGEAYFETAQGLVEERLEMRVRERLT